MTIKRDLVCNSNRHDGSDEVVHCAQGLISTVTCSLALVACSAVVVGCTPVAAPHAPVPPGAGKQLYFPIVRRPET